MPDNDFNLQSTASIGRRFMAYVIDVFPLFLLVFTFAKNIVHVNILDQSLLKTNPQHYYFIQNSVRYTVFGLWVLISFALECSTWQGSWGKRMMGIKVVNAYGEAITIQQSLQRNGVKIVAMLCFGIGFFWILFNKNRSGWYDLIAKTKVVNRE
jgi:uncharacterized RDD family membrane protein YckC